MSKFVKLSLKFMLWFLVSLVIQKMGSLQRNQSRFVKKTGHQSLEDVNFVADINQFLDQFRE